ncbi:hypothetical protein SAMN06265375_1011407 [Muriicola jejuensis]|uniref:Uncharacterized protein n=1 Tax=Muriicola jejuensis TaxID=504488 RepID=A0A6P0UB28_9FLAO|nr:hypothetical protein [Muriicola jejuensis]NER09109.1 hypothetical protein [Muriicola jejuensis]SMP11074.1 hypothetical protein SAMN06265375_1011407 [Muriicola jejuensis]
MSTPVQTENTHTAKKMNWYEVYILANHWRSDLDFYREDIRFLQQLIQKYLIWITKKENLDRVAGIRKKGHELSLRAENLQEAVKRHLSTVVDAIEGKKPVSIDDFISRHGQLEKEFADFVTDFRENRKEVFKVTEYIMDSEELQHILDS